MPEREGLARAPSLRRYCTGAKTLVLTATAIGSYSPSAKSLPHRVELAHLAIDAEASFEPSGIKQFSGPISQVCPLILANARSGPNVDIIGCRVAGCRPVLRGLLITAGGDLHHSLPGFIFHSLPGAPTTTKRRDFANRGFHLEHRKLCFWRPLTCRLFLGPSQAREFSPRFDPPCVLVPDSRLGRHI